VTADAVPSKIGQLGLTVCGCDELGRRQVGGKSIQGDCEQLAALNAHEPAVSKSAAIGP